MLSTRCASNGMTRLLGLHKSRGELCQYNGPNLSGCGDGSRSICIRCSFRATARSLTMVGWRDFFPLSLILCMLDNDKEPYFTSGTAWTQCGKSYS